jgi:hypothetical protein
MRKREENEKWGSQPIASFRKERKRDVKWLANSGLQRKIEERKRAWHAWRGTRD